ncbi:Probable serine/threonine-protein kinase WNK6 [Striga hermonthica]|uniref:non-specific serine/threonine protein kinase n=1 Tax=Striga hermonthica TaxID=68872 RepID=A0A9N7NFH3_STRHE|nr:Probable serine/threonine-protein kinase WNK6 [Striga hermonthica]
MALIGGNRARKGPPVAGSFSKMGLFCLRALCFSAHDSFTAAMEAFSEHPPRPVPDEPDAVEKSPCGRFIRFEQILGRGAFKDVYRGFDRLTGVDVAWNQICLGDDDDDKTLKNSPEIQARLCAEAVLLNSLSHTNVMRCYAYWVDYPNKTVNLITELFSSGSLRRYMKKLGGLDLQTIKNWGRQILEGLHYLHAQTPCIIHRDLKCDNIFIDIASGKVKIGDFGLATKMESAPATVLAGTPEFMAPEYYDEEYNELVDVYAFGLCLMEMMTLEYPYCECTNPAQIFKKVSNGVKPAGLERVKDFEVRRVIDRCLLPASLRPSAFELLKDPFFSFEENSMEIVQNIGAGSFGHEEEQSMGIKSWCEDASIVSGISMLYNSICLSGGGGGQGYNGKLGNSDVSMNSRITFASSSGDVSKDFTFV